MAKKKIKTAVVNGVKISPQAVQFELDRLIKFYAEHGVSAEEVRGCMSLLRDKALEQAIGAKLLLERAEQLDIPLTASDIDAEVEKVISQVGGRENYEAALAAQGVTEKDFRRELEKGAKVNKLVEQACSSVPEPTESEAEAFFAAHKADDESAGKTFVDVRDSVRDLLRHQSRGKAMDAFMAELRAEAKVEYVENDDECGCGCHSHDHAH